LVLSSTVWARAAPEGIGGLDNLSPNSFKLYSVHPKDDTFHLARSLIDRNEIEAVGVSDPAFLLFKDIVFDDVEVPANDADAPDVNAAGAAY